MSGRARSTGVYAVFDASVFVRAVVPRELPAVEWVGRVIAEEISVAVPDLVFVEVGNALCSYARDATLTLDAALRGVEFVHQIPLEVRTHRSLVGPAMRVALSRGLSVYDACYAVLAEAEDAVLVTADRRLAESVHRSELI